MAGSFGQKSNTKIKGFSKTNSSSEVIKDFQPNDSDSNENGILSPGQTVDFSRKETSNINWNKEFLTQSVKTEQSFLFQRETDQLKQEIESLQKEIKMLINETQDLDKEIVNVTLENIPENNQYQVNFLQRIKILIQNFRKNISDAQVWLESFTHKKNKRNSFWNKARNKKNGGEQYLFSGEHSASRSAN